MVKHYALTLSGSAQSLAAVLPTYVAGQQAGPNELSWSWMALQTAAANTHVVYVGGQGTVLSSSAYGFRIEAPTSTVPPAPSIVELGGGGSIRLSEWQVLGTDTEILHILVKD
jgi:hypothetical protein